MASNVHARRLSHFQGEINWAQIKADGVPGVLAKVNQGDDPGLVDGRWTANRHNALSMGSRSAGITGQCRNGMRCPRRCCSLAPWIRSGQLPPFLDFDHNGNGNTSKPLNPVRENSICEDSAFRSGIAQ